MGRSFYTISEAATRLGKSTRQVHNYIKQGLLARLTENGKTKVYQDDVEALAADRASDSPVVNRKTLFLMESRLKKLENEVLALTHALEMRSKVMRPTPQEASGLYRMLLDSFTRAQKWTFEEVKLWSSQFEIMDELTLDLLAAALQDNKVWVPFFRLCGVMLEYMEEKSKEKPDLEVQRMVESLQLGKTKMRSAIIIFIEMGKGASTETLLALSDNPKDALFQNLRS